MKKVMKNQCVPFLYISASGEHLFTEKRMSAKSRRGERPSLKFLFLLEWEFIDLFIDMPMTETRFTCSEVGRKHLLPIGAFRSAERGKMEQSGFIQLFSRRSHNGKNPWKIGWLLCAGWAGHSHRAEAWKTLSHNKGEGHSPIPALGESPLRFMFDRSGRKMLRRVVFRDYFFLSGECRTF